jgi:hypothetical protein
MKFTSIWSIPGMALAERLRRTRDWACLVTAGRMPHRLRYWVLIYEGGRFVGNGDVPVPEELFMDVLKRSGEGIES